MLSLKNRKLLIILSCVILVIAIILGACAITYQALVYKATDEAFSVLDGETSYTYKNDGNIYFVPENPTAGLIFYPGGFVEHRAYIPLMAELAERGILCVIVKMPLCLAVLDMNAADELTEAYPHIESWYIGGHSLGGAMAASYIEKNPDTFKGLVLLGAYSTADLSELDIDVISIYGSEDKVLNKEKYNECIRNLPTNHDEYVIDGGNHAYYGMYGEQKGDGEAKITNSEQISFTAQKIEDFIND